MKTILLTLVLGTGSGSAQAAQTVPETQTVPGTHTAPSARAMPGMPMPAPARTAPMHASAAVQALQLVQGWVAAAPPGAEELSAYLVLGNPGRSALALVGVSSPVAGSAMLMTTAKDLAGRETMQMTMGLKVPAGGQLKVLPGQAHLMLRNLKRQPQPGERVPVTLRFSDGSARTFTLPVRRLP